MRTFVLFALALTGMAVITDDASAIGRRNRRNSGNCCGAPVAQSAPCCGGGMAYGPTAAAYGAGYGVAATPCCGSSVAYPGGVLGAAPGTAGQTVNGKDVVIRATDGSVYALGSDGNYYPANAGIGTQSYYGAGSRYPSGVYPVGYPGTFYGPGVYPAGGTPPRTMPGVNIPVGGTVIPLPMPRR